MTAHISPLCYIMTMITGRPTKDMARIIVARNLFIREAFKQGFIQSEIAVMFRVPRNTISSVMKNK